MRKFYWILVLGLRLHSSGMAQYFPIYSQYMMNGLAINPAYAGSRDVLSATLLGRQQWYGFNGAPRNLAFGAHMPLKNAKSAVGIQVHNETLGIERNTGVFGIYAHRFRVGNGKIALGMKAGISFINEDISKVSLKTPSGDAAFDDIKEGMVMPNFGFGVYYSDDKFFGGLSLPAILNYNSGGQSTNRLKSTNFLLTGGYLWKVSDVLKLKPSTLIKYRTGSPTQFDLNLNWIFFKNDMLWVGNSYRYNEAIVTLVEIQITRQFRLGYSYDYSVGPLKTFSSGSHEIMIRYEWRDRVNTLNPLYF
jgi:type IX secretion system PorP/SprF family membrane protein